MHACVCGCLYLYILSLYSIDIFLPLQLQKNAFLSPCSEEYVKGVGEKFSKEAVHPELQGSWTVIVGDQDQCVHLWKYAGGYSSIDNANNIYRSDAVCVITIYFTRECTGIHGETQYCPVTVYQFLFAA